MCGGHQNPSAEQGSRTGWRNGRTACPALLLFGDFDDAARLAASNRYRDDREKYNQLGLQQGSPLFSEAVENAFAVLVNNQDLHSQFADELCHSRIFGPMVYAEIRARLTISQYARDADLRFCARLPPLPYAPD